MGCPLACKLGMCPDWELDQPPFGSQAGAQSTEPHQPGSFNFFKQPYEQNTTFSPIVQRKPIVVSWAEFSLIDYHIHMQTGWL